MTMSKWEYLEAKGSISNGGMTITDRVGNRLNLNELGERGWELVTAMFSTGEGLVAIFKRPLARKTKSPRKMP